jgi:hypothetical protein
MGHQKISTSTTWSQRSEITYLMRDLPIELVVNNELKHSPPRLMKHLKGYLAGIQHRKQWFYGGDRIQLEEVVEFMVKNPPNIYYSHEWEAFVIQYPKKLPVQFQSMYTVDNQFRVPYVIEQHKTGPKAWK